MAANRRVQADRVQVAHLTAPVAVVQAAVIPAIAVKAAVIRAATNAVPAQGIKATINAAPAVHPAARAVLVADKARVKVRDSVHHALTDIPAMRPAFRPITPIPARSIRGTNRVRQVRAAPAPVVRMQLHDPAATTVLEDRVHPVREVRVPVEVVVPAVAIVVRRMAIGSSPNHKQIRAPWRPACPAASGARARDYWSGRICRKHAHSQ